ncbi:MAG: hypothetical protein WCL10_15630 [Novosphingobium sp.]|uniref:hypothetical protein n=1 Tax=Novosphingobium sp. TaxID=1874826 RepID=UPI003017A594
MFNSGDVTLRECIKLIDRTEKFREWAGNLREDADLLKEFNKSIIEEISSNKKFGKIGRYAIFNGAGVVVDVCGMGGIGTMASLGLSAFDQFFLDGINEGWRPKKFVNEMRRFQENR